jgi:hypothetical protein
MKILELNSQPYWPLQPVVYHGNGMEVKRERFSEFFSEFSSWQNQSFRLKSESPMRDAAKPDASGSQAQNLPGPI